MRNCKVETRQGWDIQAEHSQFKKSSQELQEKPELQSVRIQKSQVLHSKRTSPAKPILQAAPVGFFLSKEGVLLPLALNRNKREEWEGHCSRGI